MKQVNILGLAPSWMLAPEEGECWGITGTITARRVDRSFDMHDLTWDKEKWLEHYRIWIGPYKTEAEMIRKAVIRWHGLQEEIKRIQETNTPLYSVKVYDHIPSSIAYPLEEVTKYFQCDYFSSSFDYAIALAIHEGYERLDIYGCNMSAKDEYVYQRPSFSYWLGMAKGMGISFQIHGASELMKTTQGLLYGYNVPRNKSRSHVID